MYSAPDDAPGSGRLIPAGYAAMTPLAHRPATMAENAGTPGRNDCSAAERPAELHNGQADCLERRMITMLPRLCVLMLIAVTLLASCQASVSASEQPEFRAHHCATELALSEAEQNTLLEQHLVLGVPSKGSILVRRAYVTEYDADRRIPRWAAWYANKAFLDPPERDGRWEDFHPDPHVPNPVVYEDYTHSGFARGHIVPHYISGGDRNGDGNDAECSVEDQGAGKDKDCNTVEKRPVQDPYDACTVFEVNYMSNVAPQYQVGFNGSGGLWYKLETIIRYAIKKGGKEFNLVAGPVFVNDENRKIGPHSDIHVPNSYFKIIIHDGVPLAFLFAHDGEVSGPGCPSDEVLKNCVMSVDKVEKETGLNFFSELSEADQHTIEARRNLALWNKLIKWSGMEQ